MHFYRFGRLLSRGGRGCFVSVSGEVVIAVVIGDGATVVAEVAASINFRFFPPPEAFLSIKFEGCVAVVPRAAAETDEFTSDSLGMTTGTLL